MRKIFLTLVVMIMLCQTALASPSPQWVKNLPAARSLEANDYAKALLSLGERIALGNGSSSNTNKIYKPIEQMVVVAAIQGTTAWISMHEKNSAGDWEMIMTTPGFIGKNGLGKVKEGDNKTPVGTFYFDFAFGIAPDPRLCHSLRSNQRASLLVGRLELQIQSVRRRQRGSCKF